MKFLSTTLIGTAILPLAQAIGNAIIINNCTDTTAYVWSVSSSIDNAQTLETGQSYTEQYRQDPTTGITLKITVEVDGIYNGAPETDYAYTLDNATIWYAISDVNGDPFANNTVALVPGKSACQSFVWPDGVPPSGIHTSSCSSDVDVQLTLCA